MFSYPHHPTTSLQTTHTRPEQNSPPPHPTNSIPELLPPTVFCGRIGSFSVYPRLAVQFLTLSLLVCAFVTQRLPIDELTHPPCAGPTAFLNTVTLLVFEGRQTLSVLDHGSPTCYEDLMSVLQQGSNLMVINSLLRRFDPHFSFHGVHRMCDICRTRQ